jgi:hypothetical protein
MTKKAVMTKPKSKSKNGAKAKPKAKVTAPEPMDLIDYLFFCGGTDTVHCSSRPVLDRYLGVIKIDYEAEPDLVVDADYDALTLTLRLGDGAGSE